MLGESSASDRPIPPRGGDSLGVGAPVSEVEVQDVPTPQAAQAKQAPSQPGQGDHVKALPPHQATTTSTGPAGQDTDTSQDLHQLRTATLATYNPDKAGRPGPDAEKTSLGQTDTESKVKEKDSTNDGDSDQDAEDEDPGGMRLRDLSGSGGEQFPGLKREKWWQLWRPKHAPPPPRKSLEDAPEIPLASANVLSWLTFHWVSPIMRLGYQRPLQATDLWKMDSTREANHLSEAFLANFEKRQAKAAAWNKSLPTRKARWTQRAKWTIIAAAPRRRRRSGVDGTDAREPRSAASFAARRRALEDEWRAHSGIKHASVAWALNDTFPSFWYAGLFKVGADMSQIMAPLIIKALIRFSQKVYAANHGQGSKPNIGRGVGMAIGLFLLTIMQTLCQHQFFFRSMHTGALARAALISSTYKRALSLTVRARALNPSGKLMAHISTDISRVDYCAQWFHAAWTAPIQLIVSLILLLVQLGPSALVGYAIFFILAPMQTYIMKYSLRIRKKSMVWTEARSNLLQELLSAMQVIKAFTYELPYLRRLADIRRREMVYIRKILFTRAGNQAVAHSIPVIAAVLSFVTYSATHTSFDPAIIFTALAYFNILRQPLMFLPRALSSITDAQNAVERLEGLFEAETMSEPVPINPALPLAIEVKGATFQWAALKEAEAAGDPSKKKDKKSKDKDRSKEKTDKRQTHSNEDLHTATPTPTTPAEPFMIPNLNLFVPRGTLAAIVGPVGSGKSSILQGMLGEMRTLAGSVQFGGRLGYCQQSAWIQNATLRDNIVFGQAWDEGRYWRCVQVACLVPDLEILPDGDLTEIGEKGVNLSGGQKQRVNIARALYFDADIVLFDDPLSAVDAHVGKLLFHDAILGLRREGKTVLLVTHALHFLRHVDYVYTVSNGRVVEEGTYDELMGHGGAFRRLMDEFGGAAADREEEEMAEEEAAIEDATASVSSDGDVDGDVDGDGKNAGKQTIAALTRNHMGKAAGTGKLEGRLMVSEQRKTGSVGAKVYGSYLKAGNVAVTGPFAVFFGVASQVASVMSTVWLTYWQEDKFRRPVSFYQGMYAMLGVAASITTFGLGSSMGYMCALASQTMYRRAVHHVFFSPMSFFDTQPTGRIMGVFGKDIDQMDNQLSDAWRMQVMTLSMMFGSIIIITVYFHYFIAIIAVVSIGYMYYAQYYRMSARELKRLDSMLRSLLYAHFSESLSGLATIRAYGETNRFIAENGYYMDLEDRAYLLTSANQRWLAIRLDFLGACLVFAVAIMCACGGGGISAAQIALCLTYMSQITQVLGMVTRQSAEVENSMNAVERVEYYADGHLPQEAAHEVPQTKPAEPWPAKGHVRFEEVVMAYRPGLAPVLKGISADIHPGEKIGIIGRTGAGKTSITVALYRLAELTSGRISIDGVDVSTLGLQTLRSSIAIIPQDPVLFSGTLRSNLDPFDRYDDARLHDAMKRACLIDGPVAGAGVVAGAGRGTDLETTEADTVPDGPPPAESPSPSTSDDRRKRFTLDMPIESEGANLSIGERSLVSLARALVKDARIVVLDEATAAVDLETDAKIQATIRAEFGGKTLLCIAHRLRTIISWDRILVMSAGEIEDFDTPLALFDAGGLFRDMCERSSITREEIVGARREERWAV